MMMRNSVKRGEPQTKYSASLIQFDQVRPSIAFSVHGQASDLLLRICYCPLPHSFYIKYFFFAFFITQRRESDEKIFL